MTIASTVNFYNSVLNLNKLITYVVSDKYDGEKIITVSCENAVNDSQQSTRFFLSNTFISNTRLKLEKAKKRNQEKNKQHPQAI